MSVHGYRPYRPSEFAQNVLRAARAVLSSYEAWESPLTVRQVFYRLVAEYSYAKTEAAYGSLVNYIARSRRAFQHRFLEGIYELDLDRDGAIEHAFENPLLIPFSWIRDEKGQSIEAQLMFDGADSFIEDMQWRIENMKLDRQEGQNQVLELWCEAAGMVPLMREIADPFGIRVSSGGGYDSVTAKHQLAARAIARTNDDQHTVVLHVGDFDPSGEGMFETLRDDVTQMVIDYGAGGSWISVKRVALTEIQVIDREVETAPPKPLDSRRRNFIRNHPTIREHLGTDDITAQLEALKPPELTELITESIENYIDEEILDEVKLRENEIRADLFDKLGIEP